MYNVYYNTKILMPVKGTAKGFGGAVKRLSEKLAKSNDFIKLMEQAVPLPQQASSKKRVRVDRMEMLQKSLERMREFKSKEISDLLRSQMEPLTAEIIEMYSKFMGYSERYDEEEDSPENNLEEIYKVYEVLTKERIRQYVRKKYQLYYSVQNLSGVYTPPSSSQYLGVHARYEAMVRRNSASFNNRMSQVLTTPAKKSLYAIKNSLRGSNVRKSHSMHRQASSLAIKSLILEEGYNGNSTPHSSVTKSVRSFYNTRFGNNLHMISQSMPYINFKEIDNNVKYRKNKYEEHLSGDTLQVLKGREAQRKRLLAHVYSPDCTSNAFIYNYQRLEAEFHAKFYGKHTVDSYVVLYQRYKLNSELVSRKSASNAYHLALALPKYYRLNFNERIVYSMSEYSRFKIDLNNSKQKRKSLKKFDIFNSSMVNL